MGKPLSPNEYIMAGGTKCLRCDSPDIEGGSFEADAGIAWQEMSCPECGLTWVDGYTLDTVREVCDGSEYERVYGKTTELHFERGMSISRTDIADDLLQSLLSCGGAGDQSANVEHVMNNYNITGDPVECRLMLEYYGAWEDDELGHHETNLRRLVWLAGCDLLEGEIYFG